MVTACRVVATWKLWVHFQAIRVDAGIGTEQFLLTIHREVAAGMTAFNHFQTSTAPIFDDITA
ncbi:Uncharacterised protein [Vibrio cholerae]|nr:Uncharacterised protein [Vibrio cholerae]